MVALLVGTDDGLVELGDHGTPTATHLEGRRVDALDSDGTGWWALVDGAEVWHAAPDRSGWQRWAQAPASTPLTCLLPQPGSLLVGTAGAHLLRLDEHDRLEPIDLFDELESRAEWYTPWGGPPDTRSLDGSDGTIFVGVHVGGIVSSSDGGRSWHQTSLDIHADVHQVLVAPDRPGLVMAACAEGLAVSDDGGSRWRIDDQGLHANYARAVAVAGDHVILSVSTGPDGHRSALYRRPLRGDGPFEQCRDGLPEWFDDNIDTGCLVARQDTVAAASRDGGIWRSDDQAATWFSATTIPGAVHALAIGPIRSE
ncbi:hypothetical protein BH24ACT1_BH24ACT1_06720 [soil metagenome]